MYSKWYIQAVRYPFSTITPLQSAPGMKLSLIGFVWTCQVASSGQSVPFTEQRGQLSHETLQILRSVGRICVATFERAHILKG